MKFQKILLSGTLLPLEGWAEGTLGEVPDSMPLTNAQIIPPTVKGKLVATFVRLVAIEEPPKIALASELTIHPIIPPLISLNRNLRIGKALVAIWTIRSIRKTTPIPTRKYSPKSIRLGMIIVKNETFPVDVHLSAITWQSHPSNANATIEKTTLHFAIRKDIFIPSQCWRWRKESGSIYFQEFLSYFACG